MPTDRKQIRTITWLKDFSGEEPEAVEQGNKITAGKLRFDYQSGQKTRVTLTNETATTISFVDVDHGHEVSNVPRDYFLF